MTKRSPPDAVQLMGSTRPSMALAAMAASIGGAAARQHLRAGLGGERLAGGGDSVLGDHHGSRLGPFLAVGRHGNRQRGAA